MGLVIEYDPIANSSHWAELELQEAYENNLIPDVLMGKDMTGTITRAEFAAVAVSIGTGVGVNVLLAKSLGQGDGEKAARVAGNGPRSGGLLVPVQRTV